MCFLTFIFLLVSVFIFSLLIDFDFLLCLFQSSSSMVECNVCFQSAPGLFFGDRKDFCWVCSGDPVTLLEEHARPKMGKMIKVKKSLLHIAFG